MSEVVWTDRNNTIDLLLKSDGVVVTGLDVSVTKMQLKFDSIIYDSDTTGHGLGNAFDWVSRGAEGIIILSLGAVLPTGKRDRRAELILFDADATAGIVWDQLDIKTTNEANAGT